MIYAAYFYLLEDDKEAVLMTIPSIIEKNQYNNNQNCVFITVTENETTFEYLDSFKLESRVCAVEGVEIIRDHLIDEDNDAPVKRTNFYDLVYRLRTTKMRDTFGF